MDEPELAVIVARLAALRIGVRFDLRDRRQLGQLRNAQLLQALDDGDALVAEVRRLRAERDGLKRTQTVNAAPVIGPPGQR